MNKLTMLLSLALFYNIFYIVLFTLNCDLMTKDPLQTRPQSIVGLLITTQINPWGQNLWPSEHE